MPVKINSSSGSVTLEAENTSGDKTITLISQTSKVGFAEIGIACSDETTALDTDTTQKAMLLIPRAMTLTEVKVSVTTAPAGSSLNIDVNYHATAPGSVSTIFTNSSPDEPSIAAAGYCDTRVMTGTDVTSLAANGFVTVDLDQKGSSTAGAGLKVWLLGYWT